MTTTDTAPALFDTPAPAAVPARPRGKRPPTTGHAPEPGDGVTDAAAQAPPDSPRWVMVGWRDAKGAPPLTREQRAAVLDTPQGPCARCGTAHHRYGEGGNPLCPACRTPHAPE